MASSSMSEIHSAAPPSSSRSCKYDVFLSFRGEDTRKTFVDHLYSSLQQHMILTYKDDEALPRGESIRPSLFEAIEESRIAIVILSKNYADSSWCLDELAQIMECKEERGLIVMPVFYDVNPSDVRKQTGDFGKAFAEQEAKNIGKALLWRYALEEVSSIAGWEPKNISNGHEAKGIKEIVEAVLVRLFPINKDVDEDLVGMKTRMEDLISLLEIGYEGVCMVGIWGLGGSGKTTLATTIHMKICDQFEGHFIMENVREETSKIGLKRLQENMLSTFFKSDVKVNSVAEGKHMIKSRLFNRNVLIVLDDVNELDQLDALAGSHGWFGSGSRIIITTRDEHLLKSHKVNKVYHTKLLSNEEGIQLFNKHAYNKNNPIEDYETLSLHVVAYASGLPLALKILGSFLNDKEKKEWISTLHRLKDIPETEIMEKLKISYNGLEATEKELFLDIACFWRGMYKCNAMEIFEVLGFHPTIGIKVLIQKSLITVDENDRFDMHDLIQEMGHYIVRGRHPNNPEKHSRVWNIEEIKSMCSRADLMENHMIEAIDYVGHRLKASEVCNLVSKMKILRYIDVETSEVKKFDGPNFLSNELRYFHWKGYYGKNPFPDTFEPTNLGVLRLENSFQKHLWKDKKGLPHLKVLQLKNMNNLVSTPDFDGLPCLQVLEFIYCPKLRKIHPSLGNHTSLEDIHISSCEELRKFPTIVRLENLQTLKIQWCHRMLEFPEIQSHMKSLECLELYEVGIDVVPSSIGERCTNLITLRLKMLIDLKWIECNFDAFKQLKRLRLDGLGQGRVLTKRQLFHQTLRMLYSKDVEIPSSIAHLYNLQELSLMNNTFSRLDFSLTQLTQLKYLNVSYCENLAELPDLPSSLTTLEAFGCKSLVTLGDCYKNCTELCQVSLLYTGIINDVDRLVECMLDHIADNNSNCCMHLEVNGIEVAKGFALTSPLVRGNRCRLELPENWCNDFSGFLICVVSRYIYRIGISMEQMRSGMDYDDYEDDVDWEESDGDNGEYKTWVWYVSFGLLRETTWWNPTHKALLFNFMKWSGCKGCGVGLVEKKRTSGVNETSTTGSSSSSHNFTPKFKIESDSESALTIRVDPY